MKILLKFEEFALVFLGIVAFSQLTFSWWWFVVLILLPDLGMIGYLINSKIGAYTYNFLHHRTLAVFVFFAGWFLDREVLMLMGIILFSHIALDRLLGYGLKFEKGFKFTHLGEIGN